MAVSKPTQDRVLFLIDLFSTYKDIPLVLTFGKHTFDNVILTAIDSQPVTGFKLAPPKKEVDGKKKSHMLLRLTFNNENKLIFVDDVTTWTAIINGIRAQVGNKTVVEIRKK